MSKQSSLFIEFVSKFFSKLPTMIEKINGRKNAPTYLHKTMLRKEYSADQKWESASVDTTYVVADMVAMDSPLPLKNRDSISKSNGKLPKIGMKKVMGETLINTINIMKAQGTSFEQVIAKLASDAIACSHGIDERNEANFLEAISNGEVLVADIENPDQGLRANFGYLPENQFGVTTKGSIAYEDIQRVLDYANTKGVAIAQIMISKTCYDKVRNQRWAKELAANYRGQVFDANTPLNTPTPSVFNEAFADDNGGVQFLVVDRSVIVEKDGKRSSYKPFNANKMVFLVSDQVGALVWSNTAEKTNPVSGVEYSTVEEYKLISKYSKNDPLQEFTAGQSLVLPVIEGVDQIFVLDITDVDASAQTEGDANFDYDGRSYNKAAVINAYNALEGVEVVASDITDAELLKAINALSKAKATKLFANLA